MVCVSTVVAIESYSNSSIFNRDINIVKNIHSDAIERTYTNTSQGYGI